jgi:hypothetical protein
VYITRSKKEELGDELPEKDETVRYHGIVQRYHGIVQHIILLAAHTVLGSDSAAFYGM